MFLCVLGISSEILSGAGPARSSLGGPLGSFPSRVGAHGGPSGGPQVGGEVGEALEDLLQDMNIKFASLSSSILGKLDDMALKLDGLERQLTALLAEEEGGPLPGGPSEKL